MELKTNPTPIIQCVSLGLISNKSDILVYQVTDHVSNNSFFRLIGGHIEFGETAIEALKREFKEETDQEIININSIGVFENIFFYKGEEQHEFVSLPNVVEDVLEILTNIKSLVLRSHSNEAQFLKLNCKKVTQF